MNIDINIDMLSNQRRVNLCSTIMIYAQPQCNIILKLNI